MLTFGSTLNGATLAALNSLSRINLDLNRSAQRLATGLAINRGADNPAGLISSEKLRAALASLEAESSSLQRTNNVAFAADAALEEVSSLLSDANALQIQLSNEGALSSDEKAAIQNQIDSILTSVDRIGNTTHMNGQALFNGSTSLTANGQTENLPEVATSALGQTDINGQSFNLSDIGSAGGLADDIGSAQQVLSNAITEIASARGSIGSFQKNTIQSRINTVNVATTNTAAAQSFVRDTDFAKETGNLIRNEILARTTLKMLSVLNQTHQSVLDLLG